MTQRMILTGVMGAGLLLAACGAEPAASNSTAATTAEQAPPERPATGPLSATGAPQAVMPDAEANLQWAASVVKLDELGRQGDATVKLFGVAGGDPAMNGLYTYVAFYEDPAEGWKVFKLGDFLGYRVLREAPGRVELEIDESDMNAETGVIGQRTRRLIVTWATGASGAPPTSVEVTPA